MMDRSIVCISYVMMVRSGDTYVTYVGLNIASKFCGDISRVGLCEAERQRLEMEGLRSNLTFEVPGSWLSGNASYWRVACLKI